MSSRRLIEDHWEAKSLLSGSDFLNKTKSLSACGTHRETSDYVLFNPPMADNEQGVRSAGGGRKKF